VKKEESAQKPESRENRAPAAQGERPEAPEREKGKGGKEKARRRREEHVGVWACGRIGVARYAAYPAPAQKLPSFLRWTSPRDRCKAEVSKFAPWTVADFPMQN